MPVATRCRALVVWVTVALALLGAGSRAQREAAASTASRPLHVVGVWSEVEQRRFREVLDEFQRRTGLRVTYTSLGRNLAVALEQRIAEGRTPDVAMLPQPGLLLRLVHQHQLVPLAAAATRLVEQNYAHVWRRLGTVGGKLYAVWFKAANKSLIWYNLEAFEQVGVVPPGDLKGLIEVADTFADHGVPAFAVAAADGWTLTDWFENIYISTAGPRRYDELTRHRLPWTDASVKSALTTMSQLLTSATTAGGFDGAGRTSFEASIRMAAAQPPEAAMVFEGDFVAGLVGNTGAQVGVDIDAFPFPSRSLSAPVVIGGGDAAVLLRRSAAGAALLEFFAGTRSASIWAAHGGFISPNLNVDLTVYPDATTRNIARRIVEAGNNFHFDLSDQAPASFGSIETQGMRETLRDFLVNRDVDATARRLEEEASTAYAR